MTDPLADLDLPEQALKDIAANLREMRETCGWSPEELAHMAEVPVDLILAYEADPARISHATLGQVLTAMMVRDQVDRTLGQAPDPARPHVLDQMETQMFEMEAALHIDHRRFRQAQAALDRALGLKPLPARRGRLLLSHAVVLAELRRERRALEDLEEGERCLDRAQKPLLWLRLRLQQMECLIRLGRYEDAARRQDEVEELMAEVGRDEERLQLLCMQGWIAAGRGQAAEALEILREARRQLLAVGERFTATCLALDLAALLAEQGDMDGVADLARELEELTREKSFSQPARSALKAFRWTVEQGRFDARRGRRLAEELRSSGCCLRRPYELPV